MIWEVVHKSGNLFLRKSNLKLLRLKISILSFEWKCVEVVLNSVFVKVSDYFLKFRLCYSQIYPEMCMKNLLCRYAPLHFPYKSKQNCSLFQPSGLQDANQHQKSIRTIIYSLINVHKASYARARRLVHRLLANSSRTKCAFVWMGLQTFAVPSANGSHTIRHEPNFVCFLCEHKENWMRQVSFPCTGCPLLASGSRKIN